MIKTITYISAILTISGCATMKNMSIMEYLETQRNSPLKPYIQCQCNDNLHIVNITRRGDGPQNRIMNNDTISVIEGYRVIYAFNDLKYPFARVMVEQSDSNQFDRDKKKIKAEAINLSKSVEKTKFHDSTTAGYEIFGFERDTIDKGVIIGNYTIISNNDRVVVTIYFHNQGKEGRVYNNINEFKSLRSDFINRYLDCMKKKIRQTPLSL